MIDAFPLPGDPAEVCEDGLRGRRVVVQAVDGELVHVWDSLRCPIVGCMCDGAYTVRASSVRPWLDA